MHNVPSTDCHLPCNTTILQVSSIVGCAVICVSYPMCIKIGVANSDQLVIDCLLVAYLDTSEYSIGNYANVEWFSIK